MSLSVEYECTQKCYIDEKLWRPGDIYTVPEKQKVPENCFKRVTPLPKEEPPIVLNSKK